MEIRRYKHDAAYSYTLGMALTIELISQKDSYLIRKIYVHPDYVPRDNQCNIFKICNEEQLPMEINKKVFNRLSTKENVYVLGIFDKHNMDVEPDKLHVVLVNPSDSGNLGTILRTGQKFLNHQMYLFMLDGKFNLKDIKEMPQKKPFSLVFGNEGSGLPDIFHNYGHSIYIEHNHEIDSLNLSVAFGIAANAFSE